jgi:potassium channel subfamily K, other eukaryote
MSVKAQVGNDPDEEIIANEVDVDDNENDDVDNDDNDNDITRPSFRRHLSISRTFTTFSTFTTKAPPQWLLSVKNFLTPTKSEQVYYIPNYRHTPIFSGIVIPFSILLEIPGLTEQWFVRGTQVLHPNPPALVVALALSIACAVVANLCLVVRFFEKRIKAMTILCVAFLTLHGTRP